MIWPTPLDNLSTFTATLVAAFLLAACGGDSGGGLPAGGDPGSGSAGKADTGTASDTAAAADPGASSVDTGLATDNAQPAGTDPGTGPKPDPGPLGSKVLGQECDSDQECASGMCWRSAEGKGCTQACTTMAECQALGPLFCLEIGAGLRGCVPRPSAAWVSCKGHQDCVYPLACRSNQGFCEVPECLWDGDCGEGHMCERRARRCQVKVCSADLECVVPTERCARSTCGPPLCEGDGDCAQGDICHPVQKKCTTPKACVEGDEAAGCYYNETCVGTRCLPNLCWSECQRPGDQCDPATGRCGVPCTGHADCGDGGACSTAAGLCYTNEPPMARAAARLPSGDCVACDVAVGQAVQLVSEGTVDPEGEVLTYGWALSSAPPESTLSAGAALGSAAAASLTPDVAGLYTVTLRAADPAGASSIPAEVSLRAR